MEGAAKVKKPIIFTAVNGIYNTQECLAFDYSKEDESRILDPNKKIPPLKKSCLQNLKTICESEFDCNIVLISSWRLDEEKKNFVFDCFEKSGISKERVIGSTPQLQEGGRGKEIYKWMRDYDPVMPQWVVLDDDEHGESF